MAGCGGDTGVEIVSGEEDGGALLVGEDGAGGGGARGESLRGWGGVVGGGGWGAVAFEEDLALRWGWRGLSGGGLGLRRQAREEEGQG